MSTLKIKVCGITDINQAIALEAMGVDFIGFIFYPSSKRYVFNKLNAVDLKNFNSPHTRKVGVFVNEPVESIVQMVINTGLDMIQLHGDEEPEYYIQLREKLLEASLEQVDLIKVFRVGDKMPQLDPFNDIADFYLFDTDSKLYGGTGAHFNWELLKGNTIGKAYFLSGGIGPNDLGGIEVMKQTKAGKDLFALDINSQFEIAPGIKNIEKIKSFIDALV
jgi:phosphoribosylanthranilate isomerase